MEGIRDALELSVLFIAIFPETGEALVPTTERCECHAHLGRDEAFIVIIKVESVKGYTLAV